MAVKSKSLSGAKLIQGKPKKTCLGRSHNTKLSATPRNGRRKRYRGQGQ